MSTRWPINWPPCPLAWRSATCFDGPNHINFNFFELFFWTNLILQMRIVLLVFFLFLFWGTAPCQTVNLITIDQLNERINKGLDTTFIINFWATWCSPCKKELPYFIQFENDYKKDKLKVLLISVDFKSVINSSVVPYLKKIKKRHDLFLLDEKSEQEYIDRVDKNWSGALPATLFIKAGKRKFFENEFTYPQLVMSYKNIQ